MVEGGVAIVKYLLFLSNLVLWVVGLGLIIGGSVLHLRYAGLLDILGDERLATPILLLALGALCTLLGFLGCCGAIRENYCLTVSFAVLLALLLMKTTERNTRAVIVIQWSIEMLETAALIAAYALHEPLQDSLSHQLTLGLKRYSTSPGVAKAWDETHMKLECCGVSNSSDWVGGVPESCCVQPHDGCTTSSALHQTGCITKIEGWILINAALLGGVSATLASLQVLGVCFACCLSKSILKDLHDFYY